MVAKSDFRGKTDEGYCLQMAVYLCLKGKQCLRGIVMIVRPEIKGELYGI